MNFQKTHYQIEIIDRIKNIRIKNGCSQMQLANILNLSNGQIGNIESYKYPHKYTLSHIYIICKHFSIPIHMIFIPNKENPTISEVIEKIIEYDK